ncbi:MAG: RNA polymerase sigma factor SigZ [candidate division KSB1 bacterium]|nr:RNA polymerase sigma factor SigZ [candidate division KSB1 bacterium]MDZ7311172.1 RNA polymerase sigma factor SigZ [candidate division KSB1 bacterium]
MNISEKVWQEYYSRLRAFIKSRISDDAAADDILQDVFLKMHTGLASLRDDTKIKNWLYQITRNTIIDYFRSQKSTVDIPDWRSLPETDSTENVYQELAECLQPMIKALPEKYREAVTLSELKGLKQKEVAQLQGISVSAAKSRVQRGRALLKQMLEECCRFQFDYSGRIIEYKRKSGTCDDCCR